MNSCNSVIGRAGRILAIDYGTVRLGFAISDAQQEFASPFANLTRKSPQHDARYLLDIVQQEQIEWLVVGLPIHLDGRESAKSNECRQFAKWVREVTGLPVQLHDERMTSLEAEQQLLAANLSKKQRKQRRDMLAAHLLLTAFLESDRNELQPPLGLDD